jgi:hypothetical protein
MNTLLENEIAKRFGILPHFFRLAPGDPAIASNLWGFAQFAYLDNPLPSLFKERLFVYLSRFCEVRYCIARHLIFSTGWAIRPAIPPAAFRGLRGMDGPIASFPEPDSLGEQALFACATHVFLQSPDAPQAYTTSAQPARAPINALATRNSVPCLRRFICIAPHQRQCKRRVELITTRKLF